ncbi:Arginyl-tRNA--protein transferase 1 [Erysiphe neolycopersici]|uniref:Arginyl-tRNA--protein transferase 1 n=1 Tax=Erysiphe neolycopersici TaxID=212602 RepID=A0A420HTP0_9PEZI|nr:Arginyl-tRNA--protein transferase 1 [Erysiphe neolycopersici]
MSILAPDQYSCGSCGYCGNRYGDYSYRADGIDLTGEFYQELLDRGWRRSGNLLYKPDQRASCCPPYTIRVDSLEYRPSKEQRQALNRFNKQIIGQKYLTAAARLYPRTREQAQKRKQEFDLVERIHECELSVQKAPLVHDQAFLVTLETNKFTEEKFHLFENYQRIVHKQKADLINRESFKQFLCTSPIRITHKNVNGTPQPIGSYHQCYWIDGNLVAIGVLDLLPHSVSGVYFMYHESVREFNFGKISAMREIALAKEKGYRWWYPGFYIHENIKMKYKRKFSPLQILSPETYQWCPLTKEILSQLNSSKYLSFTTEENCAQTTLPSPQNPQIKISTSQSPMVEDIYIPLYERDMPGTLNKDQLMTEIDLDSILVRIPDVIIQARKLLYWNETSLENYSSLKSIVAEIACALGPELCKNVVLDL